MLFTTYWHETISSYRTTHFRQFIVRFEVGMISFVQFSSQTSTQVQNGAVCLTRNHASNDIIAGGHSVALLLSNKSKHKEERGTEEGLTHTEMATGDMSGTDVPLPVSPSHPLESSQEGTCCHMWVTGSVNKFSDGTVSSIP